MTTKKILLVESDPTQLRVLRSSLEQDGYAVIVADDVGAALTALDAESVDIVLAAPALRRGDGFELVEHMQEHSLWSRLPVVLMIEGDLRAARMRGVRLGIEEFMTKPIFVKEMLARVSVLLAKQVRERLILAGEEGQVSGSLESMAIVDLLESLERGEQSGTVTVRSGEQTARVHFRRGQIVDASVSRLRAEEAVFRILTWKVGTYEVELAPSARAALVDTPTRELLEAGVRQAEEFRRLAEALPGLDSILEVDLPRLRELLGDVPEAVEALIRLFDGKRSLHEVIDDSPFEDRSTLRTLVQLFEEDVLVRPELVEVPVPLSRTSMAGYREPLRSEAVEFPLDTSAAIDLVRPSQSGVPAQARDTYDFEEDAPLGDRDSSTPGDRTPFLASHLETGASAAPAEEGERESQPPAEDGDRESQPPAEDGERESQPAVGESERESDSHREWTPRFSSRVTLVADPKQRRSRSDSTELALGSDSSSEETGRSSDLPQRSAEPVAPPASEPHAERRSEPTAYTAPSIQRPTRRRTARDGHEEEVARGAAGRTSRAPRRSSDDGRSLVSRTPDERRTGDPTVAAERRGAARRLRPAPRPASDTELDSQLEFDPAELEDSSAGAAFFSTPPPAFDPQDAEEAAELERQTYLSDEEQGRRQKNRLLVVLVVGLIGAAGIAAGFVAAERPSKSSTIDASPTEAVDTSARPLDAKSAAATVGTTVTAAAPHSPSAAASESAPSAAASASASAPAPSASIASDESEAPRPEGGPTTDGDDDALPKVSDPLGEAYKKLDVGLYAESIGYAKAAIRKDPEDADGYYALFTAYEALGRVKEGAAVRKACAENRTRGTYKSHCPRKGNR